MRQPQRLRAGMLFTASLWMVGCQAPTQASTEAAASRTDSAQRSSQSQGRRIAAQQFQIEVAPTQVNCVGVVPMQCLHYRKVGSLAWLAYPSGIEGFDYQPDYRYILDIKQTPIENPPADGSSLHWQLVRIVEKHPVTQ